jgi:cellulose synthase/poly-beta-1,6-N-acetylglucosamine synthase-like glycosyltransferase
MILLWILVLFCCFWLFFPLLSTLVSLPVKFRLYRESKDKVDFACIVTVYQNLEIAVPLVKSLLKQKYPNFHIYIIADKVEQRDFPLKDSRMNLIFPKEALNSKVRSIELALDSFGKQHEYCVIFDPDNLAHPDFLNSLNNAHQAGHPAAQGKRTAKNLNTDYACLDALGEYYYDFVARYIPYRIGSSSTIAGSGMSIRFDLYAANIKKEMDRFYQEGLNVSEDKALQLDLVADGHRIAYVPNAIILDEKVSTGAQVSRQRTRWLNSYFRHLKDILPVLQKGIRSKDINQWYFSLNVAMPPMVFLFGLAGILIMITLLVNWTLLFLILAGVGAFVVNFLFALQLNHTPKPIWKVLPKIPLFVINQILSILQIRKANKDFMHTSNEIIEDFDAIWSARKEDFSHLDLSE